MVNALAQLSKVWDNDIVMPLREATIGRKLIPKNNALSGLGIGKQQYNYFTFQDLSAAIVDYRLPDNVGAKDTVDITETSIKMAFLDKEFTIPRQAYESYKAGGVPVDNSAAIALSDLIADAENTLFIQGWAPDGSTYLISGLYQSANNTETTADDFGTYGNAVNKVTLAMGELLTDKILPPYNLTLNPAQYAELAGSESTTGKSEWDTVMKLLNTGTTGGNIFMSTAVTAGTGMMTGVGPKYFDYIEGQPPKYELTLDSKLGSRSPIYGALFSAVVPRIKQTNAICTLTNI